MLAVTLATNLAFKGPAAVSMSSTEVEDGRSDDPSRLDDSMLLFWC